MAQTSGSKQPMLNMPHSCRTTPGIFWSYQVEDKLMEAIGSSKLSVEVTERWNSSKLGLLPIGLHSEAWDWSWWDLLSSCEVSINQSAICICTSEWSTAPPNGCCNILPKLHSGGGHLHAATRQLQSTRKGASHLQAQEVHVRLETVATMLEQSPYRVIDIGRFCTKLSWPRHLHSRWRLSFAVAAYVDDLIIAKKTEEEMQQVKKLLQSRFQ